MITRTKVTRQVRDCYAAASHSFLHHPAATIPHKASISNLAGRDTRARSIGTWTLRESRRKTLNDKPQAFGRAEFCTSSILQKGKKGKNRDEDESPRASTSNGKAPRGSETPIQDIINVAALKETATTVQEKLKRELSQLKPGGRFDPILLESLRVDISKLAPKDASLSTTVAAAADHSKPTSGDKFVKNKPETHADGRSKSNNITSQDKKRLKPTATTLPLSELAQVIPRGGKQIIVMLHEDTFLKAVTSAIAASQYSLNPQSSPTNPLELIVPIPPPTAQSRKITLERVGKMQEKAENDVNHGRGEMQKTLRSLSLNKELLPDDLKTAQKNMEKVLDAARVEIKRLCDATRKVLQ